VIGPLLLLECFHTKLIHYYLPAFPACALLTAWLVMRVVAEGVNIRRKPLGRLAIALLVGIGLVGIVVLGAAATMVERQFVSPMLLLALVLAAGTLIGASSFQQGATERAAYWLAATWALLLLIATAWLIPLAEPYRSSRILGEKLASLAAKLKIEPVLLDYKEPGVFYAFGHPIATTDDRDGFFAQLAGGRSVLTVARPSEVERMRSYFGLFVTPVDQVEGFIMAKGKKQTLQLAVVRKKDEPLAEPTLGVTTRTTGLTLENTLVK
jgi:hypothetical protein